MSSSAGHKETAQVFSVLGLAGRDRTHFCGDVYLSASDCEGLKRESDPLELGL